MRLFDEQTWTTTPNRSRFARIVLCAAISLCVGLSALAQSSKSQLSLSVVDQGVVFPPSKPFTTVHQDPSALTIIRAYQKAVGHASWNDMEATGKMVPAAMHLTGASVAQNATLWILGHTGYRLDVQTPKGTISIRIDGAHGAMRPPGNRILPMDPRDAAVGLLAFPQIENPSFPGNNTSLIDQGTVQVDGVALQRVTAEIPWTGATGRGQELTGIGITDLYFNPVTHLLVKSANLLQGTDPRLARYLKVVTYGDYRVADDIATPHVLSESLNSRRIWELRISQAHFSSTMGNSIFHF